MNRQVFLSTSLFIALVLLPLTALADAIVVSRAMFASTIAEYFVEEEHIRLELEIGQQDLGAFRNLMPDPIYQQLGFGDEPFDDRLDLFFGRDMPVLLDGKPLQGGILKMGPETRILRDAVTGEALPPESDEPEVVIRATLLFPLEERPDSLTLIAPSQTGMASIGFVLYHQGVAVNDFRFLSSGQTVNLDWEDAWYSTFEQRALRRQYFSPMAGFIYVEPFEVRKEIIVRPKDIQRLTDIGLDGVEVITPEMQDGVKQGIVDFLAVHFSVKIDGVAVEGEIDRVNFLDRSLRSSVVVDGQDIKVLPATVGVIYVFPTEGLPQSVEMDWDLFTPRMQLIPASTVDQAGPLPTFLEPDFSTLEWQNFLTDPEMPTLTALRDPPTSAQRLAFWGQPVFATLAFLALFVLLKSMLGGRGFRPAPLLAFVVCIGLAGWCMNTWRQAQLNPVRLQELVGGLLHNVYRAFDYRGEEAVYDVLARSVAGDLLNDVYLETRKGLELANQGGAQVKVKDIEISETQLRDDSDGNLQVEARWNVMGSVGHWGHVHQRVNAYHANLTVSEVDGTWKLTGLEILTEERL